MAFKGFELQWKYEVKYHIFVYSVDGPEYLCHRHAAYKALEKTATLLHEIASTVVFITLCILLYTSTK